VTFDASGVLVIYHSAVGDGWRKGWRDGWADGYLAGLRAQALRDEQMLSALAEEQRAQGIIREGISRTVRGTISAMEAEKARRNQYRNFDIRRGVKAA
jgi:hypothetical protein